MVENKSTHLMLFAHSAAKLQRLSEIRKKSSVFLFFCRNASAIRLIYINFVPVMYLLRTSFLAMLLLLLPHIALAQPVVTETNFSVRSALGNNKVTGIITDRRGLLWVSTWGGLYRFDGYRFVVFNIRPGDGNDLDNSRIDDVQQYKDGNLICRSYDNFYLYDVSKGSFRLLPGINADKMYALRGKLYSDKEFTRAGYRLRISNHELTYLDEADGQWKALATDIRLWHVNPDGVVWIVTGDGSFRRIVISRRYFEPFDDKEDVLSLFRDARGLIWQANNDGTVLLRGQHGQKLGYVSSNGSVGSAKRVLGRVYSMTSDSQGRILLGTRGDGLFVMIPKGKEYSVEHYRHIPDDAYSLSDDNIYSLCTDGKAVWVGTLLGGLNLMKAEGGRTVFLNRSNRCRNFPENGQQQDVRSITKVGNTIVLGTSNGLFTFKSNTDHPEKIHFYLSRRINNDTHSLASNGIMSVNYIKGQGLFVCTSHGGLCWTDSQDLLHDNLQFKTWNLNSGAPSDCSLQAFADGNGQTWAVFETILSRFNIRTGTSDDFMQEAGEEGTFSGSMPVSTADGLTLFASHGGVKAARLNTLSLPKVSSPILITSLSANGTTIPYSIDADTLILEKEQRNFSLEFSALEMAANDFVEYAYRLEGRDTTWIKQGHNRTISFFNLGAGTYELLIRASNNNRVWSQTPRRITIILRPTFWETPWAVLLYVILGLLTAATVMAIAFYVYRLRLNAAFEQRLTDMRLRYFTDISHDLRTPLTLIMGPVSELLNDSSLTEKSRNYLQLIHHNAKRMLLLTNQILDFRKIEADKMRLLIERIDLKEELSDVMTDFRYLAEEHQIDFRLDDHSGEAAYIWGDKDKIQKIFFNLLSNAFKYTAVGKSVWIELYSDEESVTAAVCDTGKGMGPNILGRLFERFETSLTDNYMKQSSGIGLSLVKKLVGLHHASLNAESKEGEGSRFSVVFQKGNQHFKQDQNIQMMTGSDRQKTSDLELSAEEPADTADSQEKSLKVLVVEDDAEMLQFVSDILQPEFQVLQATDGSDGLSKATTLQPDLIVSDINMPRMNGWEMLAALKESTDTSHIPVVLLTANNTLDDRIKGAAQGVEDYIAKPFSPLYLRVRLQAILQKRQERQKEYLENYTLKASEVVHLELPENNSGMIERLAKIDVQMMERLKDFMEEHLSDNMPIQDLADHIGLSRTLFYRKIRTITGLTPVDFYRKYHIERAAQLMRNEGLTVSEACYRTGFSDPKYFTKVFKKFIGQTPSDYRNCVEQSAD